MLQTAWKKGEYVFSYTDRAEARSYNNEDATPNIIKRSHQRKQKPRKAKYLRRKLKKRVYPINVKPKILLSCVLACDAVFHLILVYDATFHLIYHYFICGTDPHFQHILKSKEMNLGIEDSSLLTLRHVTMLLTIVGVCIYVYFLVLATIVRKRGRWQM